MIQEKYEKEVIWHWDILKFFLGVIFVFPIWIREVKYVKLK